MSDVLQRRSTTNRGDQSPLQPRAAGERRPRERRGRNRLWRDSFDLLPLLVRLTARSGLHWAGIWVSRVPALGTAAESGLVMYFLCAAGIHIRARETQCTGWVNWVAFISLAVAAGGGLRLPRSDVNGLTASVRLGRLAAQPSLTTVPNEELPDLGSLNMDRPQPVDEHPYDMDVVKGTKNTARHPDWQFVLAFGHHPPWLSPSHTWVCADYWDSSSRAGEMNPTRTSRFSCSGTRSGSSSDSCKLGCNIDLRPGHPGCTQPPAPS